jgi:hypothetical protein
MTMRFIVLPLSIGEFDLVGTQLPDAIPVDELTDHSVDDAEHGTADPAAVQRRQTGSVWRQRRMARGRGGWAMDVAMAHRIRRSAGYAISGSPDRACEFSAMAHP